MNVVQNVYHYEALSWCCFLSAAHRHPFSPWCGNDRKLYNRVQRIGPLRRLLDARASLPCTQDQEPPETLHLRALPGEREPGTPGQRERQAGWRGAPVAPSTLPQCLFQQWSWCQSGLPLRGDAPERCLWVSTHLPFWPHSQKGNLSVRNIINRSVHKMKKRYTHYGRRNMLNMLKPMPVFVGNNRLWLIQSLAWTPGFFLSFPP